MIPKEDGIVIVIVRTGETEDEAMARLEHEDPGALDRAQVTYVPSILQAGHEGAPQACRSA